MRHASAGQKHRIKETERASRQTGRESERFSPPNRKRGRNESIRDGELSREVTSPEVSSPTCFSMELGSEGWEGTEDDGPESGVQDCHPPSIENRPPGVPLFSFQPQKPPQKGPKSSWCPRLGEGPHNSILHSYIPTYYVSVGLPCLGTAQGQGRCGH